VTFRTRILLACIAAALVPLALFATGARREVRARVGAQFEERVAATTSVIRQDLDMHRRTLDARLLSAARRLDADAVVRAALLQHTERTAVLDFAPDVMPALNVDYLLLMDGDGTVLSSGHFRSEFDRRSTALPALLAADGPVLVRARTATGPLLALARARAVDIGSRRVVLAAGVRVDSTFVDRLARDAAGTLVVALEYPGGALASRRAGGRSITETLRLPFVEDAGGAAATGEAQWVVSHSLAPLLSVQRGMDAWLLAAGAAAVLLALVIAHTLAARVNRPLEDLARRSVRVDLERMDVGFATKRNDEIGTLSRMLDGMVQRLRTSAQALRVAERRATVGDLARQVNHDVRNGLLPIRNVIRHLDEVARDDPASLAGTFVERADTLYSGIGYLEQLAGNYAQLTPQTERTACDLNATVRGVADNAAGAGSGRIVLQLSPGAPRVLADPVALRRVVENLIVNAVESLGGSTGTVRVSTTVEHAADERRVALRIADEGAGIEAAALDRIFDDFYTTKARGTGLGLSIVRRLVADMGGRIDVESEVGRGTTFNVLLPAAP
jgi:two-component system, NtrC family, nitrogen regulation sensor histidine kinase NtrY